MLNRDGIRKTTYGAPRQILANVEHQYSVGCIVPASMGPTTATNGVKLVKAGTPININLSDTNTAVKAPAPADTGTTAVSMNAVLLHDVDVTDGDANGTALIFGFVNLNRLDTDVVAKITTAQGITGASPLLTFVKL